MNTAFLRTAAALMLLAPAMATTASPAATPSMLQMQAVSGSVYWYCPVVDKQGNLIVDLVSAGRTHAEAIAAAKREAEWYGGTVVNCYPAGG